MVEDQHTTGTGPVRVAICVGSDAHERFGRVLRHLAVGLVDQAIQLRILSPDPRVHALSLGPIQTVSYDPPRWPVSKRRLAQLVELVAQDPPHVIHAMSAESYPEARWLTEAFDADLVLQISSMIDLKGITELDRTSATNFVATSTPLFERLGSQLESAAERTCIIRPGVLARPEITCFKYGERMATILCTAPLEQGRGIDELIEAVAALRKRGRGIMLFLLGRGGHDSVLRRMVRERKLSACVTLAEATGATDAALESADIHLNPAVDNSFSIGGLQAMAAGVVVVTPQNPACDHYIDGETCVVCPAPTTDALIDAIERVVSDRTASQELARSGLEFVRKHHSISTMAEQFAGLYRRLVLARATIKMPE